MTAPLKVECNVVSGFPEILKKTTATSPSQETITLRTTMLTKKTSSQETLTRGRSTLFPVTHTVTIKTNGITTQMDTKTATPNLRVTGMRNNTTKSMKRTSESTHKATPNPTTKTIIDLISVIPKTTPYPYTTIYTQTRKISQIHPHHNSTLMTNTMTNFGGPSLTSTNVVPHLTLKSITTDTISTHQVPDVTQSSTAHIMGNSVPNGQSTTMTSSTFRYMKTYPGSKVTEVTKFHTTRTGIYSTKCRFNLE